MKTKKRVFAWQKERKPKQLVDYFPRNNQKGDDSQFNLAIIDKSKGMLSKKRKADKPVLKLKNSDDYEEYDMDKTEVTFGKNTEISQMSRVRPPKFKAGDLVLLSIFEIKKDYMVANYTRNIKAMIHKSYSGLDENQSFEKLFKIGDLVAGAVVSPGNDIQINTGYLNKKLLVSIDPKIINTGISSSNIEVGMDLWGQLVKNKSTGDYSVNFRFTNESKNDIVNKNKKNWKKIADDIEDYSNGEEDNDGANEDDLADDGEGLDDFADEDDTAEKENKDSKQSKQKQFARKMKRTANQAIAINLSDDSSVISSKFIPNSYYFFKVNSIKSNKTNEILKVSVSLDNSTNILSIKQCEKTNLKPGFLFNCTITRELQNGVEVAFGGLNIGGIFEDHMCKGKSFLARVIHVNPNYVSLSALKHITKLFTPDIESKLEMQGKIYENVEVERKLFGSSFQLKNDSTKFFLHQIQSNDNKYEPNDVIPSIRVKEYNFFDNKPIATSKESILKEETITWDSLKIGQFYDLEIKEIHKDSLKLEINNFIAGRLKREHISDFPLSKIPKKFSLNKKIRVRIFDLDRKTNKLEFTMKESYLDEAVNLVSDFNQIREGDDLLVVYVGDNLFQHCGGILGRLDNITNEEYKLYKPYTLKVYKVLYNTHKIYFTNSTNVSQPGIGDYESILRKNPLLDVIAKTLNNSNAELKETYESRSKETSLEGKICNFKVIKPSKLVKLLLKENIDTNLIQDNLDCITKKFMVVKYMDTKSKKGEKSVKFNGYCFCPKHLISDLFQKQIFEYLTNCKDMTIEMLVLYHDLQHHIVFVTNKYSLTHHKYDNLSTLEENQYDHSKLYNGYVNKIIENKGLVVKFLNSTTIFSKFSKNFNNYIEGQTVVGKFEDNLKVKENQDNKYNFNLNVYKNNTEDFIIDEGNYYMKIVLDNLCLLVNNCKAFKHMKDSIIVGSNLNGKIGLIKDYGIMITFSEFSEFTGFLRKEHMLLNLDTYQLGQVKAFKVVDLDFENAIVYLTDKDALSLVSKELNNENIKNYYKTNVNTCQDFTIEVVQDYYISVCLKDNTSIKGILPCNLLSFNFGASNLSKIFNIGMNLNVKIVSYNEDLGKLVLNYPSQIAKKLSSPKVASAPTQNIISLGYNVHGIITGIKGSFIYVFMSKTAIGRIHLSNFDGNLEEIKKKLNDNKAKHGKENKETLLDEDLKIDCKIIHINEILKKNIKICDLTSYTKNNTDLIASNNKISTVLDLKGFNPNVGVLSKLDLQSKTPMTIEYGNNHKIKIDYYRIPCDLLKNNFSASLYEMFKVGQLINFYSKSTKDKDIIHSLSPITDKKGVTNELHPNAGDKLMVRIMKSFPGKGYIAAINDKLSGFVDISEISDELLANPTNHYKLNTVCIARILQFDETIQKFIISLRSSLVSDEYYKILTEGSNLEYKKKFSSFEQIADYRNKIFKYGIKNVIQQNLVCIGYVISSSEKGIFIKINKDNTVRIALREIADENSSKPYLLYNAGQLVICRITSITMNEDQIDKINGSLRESIVKYNITMKLKDLVVNNFYQCIITSGDNKKYNVIILGSTFTGILKKDQCNKKMKIDISAKPTILLQLIELDKNVKPFIMNFSNATFDENEIDDALIINKVSEDYLEKNKFSSELYDNVKQICLTNQEEEIDHELKDIINDANDINYEELLNNQEANENNEVESENEEVIYESNTGNTGKDMDIDEEDLVEDNDNGSELNEENVISDSEDENLDKENEDDIDQPHHLNSKKRQKSQMKEELIIREKEKEIPDYLENPVSVDDFEKLILSDTNNSVNWIKYASYILDNMNLASSRKIFERAIKSIDITNLKEKLNIWIAYINLDYTYADSETYKSTVERALEVNDKKAIYKHLITIYSQSKKFDLALEIYKLCLKSYFGDIELWKKFLEFLFEASKQGFQNEDFATPKDGLNKALQIIPKSKHIDVLIKYGQLQYKYGFQEEARCTFDSVLKNHPKRSDIWLVYADKEIKHGNIDKFRLIFEKIFTIDFKIKVLKTIIRKYLETEMKFGTPKTVENAKLLTQKIITDKMNEINEAQEIDENNENNMEMD